jgi:hypothetical protein
MKPSESLLVGGRYRPDILSCTPPIYLELQYPLSFLLARKTFGGILSTLPHNTASTRGLCALAILP